MAVCRARGSLPRWEVCRADKLGGTGKTSVLQSFAFACVCVCAHVSVRVVFVAPIVVVNLFQDLMWMQKDGRRCSELRQRGGPVAICVVLPYTESVCMF